MIAFEDRVAAFPGVIAATRQLQREPEPEAPAPLPSSTRTVYISNSCGELFTFTMPPSYHDTDVDETVFFDEDPYDFLETVWDVPVITGNRTIGEIVGNNFDSCDWGELDALAVTHTTIDTPGHLCGGERRRRAGGRLRRHLRTATTTTTTTTTATCGSTADHGSNSAQLRGFRGEPAHRLSRRPIRCPHGLRSATRSPGHGERHTDR